MVTLIYFKNRFSHCIALLLVIPASVMGVDREEVVGHWVLDHRTQNRILDSEIQYLESDKSGEAKEARKRLENAKNRMYTELTLRDEGTFEMSMGVAGGISQSINGSWVLRGNHVTLAWGSIHKMDLSYEKEALFFYEDGRPHKPGDGMTAMKLQKISHLQHSIRNSFFGMILKKFGPGKVFGLLGIIVLILLGLVGILNKIS